MKQQVLTAATPGFMHINRYVDQVNKCISAKLLPGEFYVTSKPEMITTVLGSCVSACIYDPLTGCGGMNHFMLPGDERNSKTDASARYGLYAMESLINEILKLGASKDKLRAKLFGGGQIIENMTNVGLKNIRFAKTFLFSESIELVSSDLGLAYPRKVNFYPSTGKAFVKRLKTLHNSTIQDREIEYMEHLKKDDISGEIELF